MLVTIRDYTDADAADFYAINAAWIGAMFVIEAHDEHVLTNPRAAILKPGGVILLAETEAGVIGTGALMPDGHGGMELTKMGVTAAAQGQKVGATLLNALLARAATMGADPLYLLTSRRCAVAIHLYEKAGFIHDAEIMARHGGGYARCNVAMRWPQPG